MGRRCGSLHSSCGRGAARVGHQRHVVLERRTLMPFCSPCVGACGWYCGASVASTGFLVEGSVGRGSKGWIGIEFSFGLKTDEEVCGSWYM